MSLTDPDTAHVYGKTYFQGGKSTSNYDDYVRDASGPSRILAEMLHRALGPKTALDVGCAVGHTVKGLREYGVGAYGIDISHWAVGEANAPQISQLDISKAPIEGSYDLVYCYDVVEHIPMSRLNFAICNLWRATNKVLVVVPALYPEGTTEDLNEPTHLIFHDYPWWRNFCEQCGCRFDPDLSEKIAREEHSVMFNYSTRIMAFSK